MILDTFYLLFKSDTANAQKDIDDLTKKIDTLREKGKARSEQETKDLKDMVKQRNDALKQNKEENAELDKKEQAYGKLGNAVASYAAGIFSLNALKSGVANAITDNAALYRQAELIGQSAEKMKNYGLAIERAGGSADSFNRFLQSSFEEYSSVGLPLPPIEKLVEGVRHQLDLAGDDPVQRQKVFERLNIGEDLRTFFNFNNEKLESELAYSAKIAGNTEEIAAASQEMRASLVGLKQLAETFLGRSAVSLYRGEAGAVVANWFNDIGKKMKDNSKYPFEVRPTPEASALMSNPSSSVVNRWDMAGRPLSRIDQDVAFWMSQGYTKDQAAAWAAAAKRESGNNPAAIGDGGLARGLFQWHPDRQRLIKEGTGIDVTKAGYDEQLRAAAWEAKQRGDDERIKNARSAMEAAAVHTKFFERPANMLHESILRGRSAIDIAQQYPTTGGAGTSKTINVKVGDVNVHTSGVDANAIAGDVGRAMKDQIDLAISNVDDGVKF